MESSPVSGVGSSNALSGLIPAVPDLFFPQQNDLLKHIATTDIDFISAAHDGEQIVIPTGSMFYTRIHSCKFARWTGFGWIFYCMEADEKDGFFVRATSELRDGKWEVVSDEEPSAAISGS